MDKHKIVKRLEYCAENKCDICQEENGSGFPWIDGRCYGFTERLYDTIALLKAQEPRVMAWRNVIGAALECKPVYIEVKDSEDKELRDDRWAMVTQYKDSITNGMIRAMSSYVTSEILFADWYNKSWRCWTSSPTDEQREATPWKN